MGPRDRARQLRPARRRSTTSCSSAPSWFYEAVSFSAAMKSQTPGGARPTWAATPTPTASGSTAAATTRCTFPPTRRPSCSGRSTVYDADTRCLIDNDQQRGDRGSRDATSSTTTTAPSTSISARTAPPAARATGSRPSPGRHWFSYFRLLRAAGAVLRPQLEARRHMPHLRNARRAITRYGLSLLRRPRGGVVVRRRAGGLQGQELRTLRDGSDGTRTRDLRRDRPAL